MYVEIIKSFRTDYWICGIAPHDDDLAILAFVPDEPEEQAQSDGVVQGAALVCVRVCERARERAFVLVSISYAVNSRFLHNWGHFREHGCTNTVEIFA